MNIDTAELRIRYNRSTYNPQEVMIVCSMHVCKLIYEVRGPIKNKAFPHDYIYNVCLIVFVSVWGSRNKVYFLSGLYLYLFLSVCLSVSLSVCLCL